MSENDSALHYGFDLLYDIKTREELDLEIERLSVRLGGLVKLCKDAGIPNACDPSLGDMAELRSDALRLDWLSLVDNTIGNVQLPTQCVMHHPDSLRDAIDAAMALEVAGK